MRGAPVERGADFYDAAWAERWLDCSRYGPSFRHQRRLVTALLRGHRYRSVLDVGCGNGAKLGALLAAVPIPEVCGIDVSAEAVRLAQEAHPRGEFRVLDITRERWGRTFDLVLCCDVLEHIADDLAALRQMRRMTGGHLLITTLQGRMRPWEREVGHVRSYTRATLEARLAQAGYTPVRVVEWGFPFYSPIHRALLGVAPGGIAEGRFGRGRRILAHLVYGLFFLNSWRRGDILVILAGPDAGRG